MRCNSLFNHFKHIRRFVSTDLLALLLWHWFLLLVRWATYTARASPTPCIVLDNYHSLFYSVRIMSRQCSMHRFRLANIYRIKWEHIITEVTRSAVSPAVTTNASPLNMPSALFQPWAEKCWYRRYAQRPNWSSGAHLETRHANTCEGAVIPSSRNNNGVN